MIFCHRERSCRTRRYFPKKTRAKKKFSKSIEREKKELLAIKGIDKATYERLSRAGIINATCL